VIASLAQLAIVLQIMTIANARGWEDSIMNQMKSEIRDAMRIDWDVQSRWMMASCCAPTFFAPPLRKESP